MGSTKSNLSSSFSSGGGSAGSTASTKFSGRSFLSGGLSSESSFMSSKNASLSLSSVIAQAGDQKERTALAAEATALSFQEKHNE